LPGQAAEAAVTNAAPPRREQERVPGQTDPDLAADDVPGDRVPGEDLNQRQEKLIDEAVEETFPASDPIAPKRITKEDALRPWPTEAAGSDWTPPNRGSGQQPPEDGVH